MGVRVRFRATDLNRGPVVHYEATSYVVLQDNTVELRRGGRVVGAVHRERWDSLEIVEEEEGSPAGGAGRSGHA